MVDSGQEEGKKGERKQKINKNARGEEREGCMKGRRWEKKEMQEMVFEGNKPS